MVHWLYAPALPGACWARDCAPAAGGVFTPASRCRCLRGARFSGGCLPRRSALYLWEHQRAICGCCTCLRTGRCTLGCTGRGCSHSLPLPQDGSFVSLFVSSAFCLHFWNVLGIAVEVRLATYYYYALALLLCTCYGMITTLCRNLARISTYKSYSTMILSIL